MNTWCIIIKTQNLILWLSENTHRIYYLLFERGKKHGHNFVYEELRRLIKQRDKRAKLMSSKL